MARRRRSKVNQHDVEKAVVAGGISIHSKYAQKSFQVTGMTIRVISNLKTGALEWYRRDKLKSKLDMVRFKIDSKITTKDLANKEIAKLEEELLELSFDDLPMKEVEQDGKRVTIDYFFWWCASVIEGQVSTIFECTRKSHPDLTYEDLFDICENDMHFAIDATNSIAKLSESIILKN